MLRWIIAAASCLALAILTLNADPDALFHASAAPACPANAKPANLNFTLKDVNNKDVKLSSLAVNPRNLSLPSEQDKLVITGVVRPAAGQDRMQSVMRIVSKLHDDSLFAAGYENIKLASTRVSEGPEGAAEFVIECR